MSRKNTMTKKVNMSTMMESKKIVLMLLTWKLEKMLSEALKKWWWKNRQKHSEQLLSRNKEHQTVEICMMALKFLV